MKTCKTILCLAAALCLFTVAARADDIERTTFKLTVPDKSTVDPADADIDLDHMTNVNLPNGNLLGILMVDDKTLLDKVVAKVKATYVAKLKDCEEKPCTLAGKYPGKAIVLTGSLNGTKVCFEVDVFTGKEKGFVVVSTCLLSEREETILLVKKALDSFVIKE